MEGEASGSTARKRVFRPDFRRSRTNGRARPEKLLPPPTQPTTRSGMAPARSIWSMASSPMMVWCRSTWLRTLPSEYLVSSREAASSTASEMAIPRLPGESGSCSRILRPAAVSGDGLGRTSAPQTCIMLLR